MGRWLWGGGCVVILLGIGSWRRRSRRGVHVFDGRPRGQTVRRTNVCHTKWWHENNVPL